MRSATKLKAVLQEELDREVMRIEVGEYLRQQYIFNLQTKGEVIKRFVASLAEPELKALDKERQETHDR